MESRRVFVDTGFLYARLDTTDQWHKRANQASRQAARIVTSNFVVNETATLLQRRGLFSTALSFIHSVRGGKNLEVVTIDSVLQEEAWELLGRWGGVGASPVDCASFAVMHRLSIRKAFTFDRHFRAAGFEIL